MKEWGDLLVSPPALSRRLSLEMRRQGAVRTLSACLMKELLWRWRINESRMEYHPTAPAATPSPSASPLGSSVPESTPSPSPLWSRKRGGGQFVVCCSLDKTLNTKTGRRF